MAIFDLLREPMKTAGGYVAGGKPLPAAPKGVIPAKLNANENQLGPSKKVLQAIQDELENINLYPFEQIGLTRRALAEWLSFEPENIRMANGSMALICAIGDVFLNVDDEVAMCTPSYMAYYSLPGRYGAKLIEVPNKNFATDVEGLLAAITDKTKLCIIVNPNNPTGGKISNAELQYYMDNVPEHVITIIDEAYIEWVDEDDYQNATKYVRENRNVIVLRTFSKIFGLAGLRFGYAITTPEISKYLGVVEANYGPDRLALVAARVAVKDTEHLAASLKNNTDGRNYLTKELKALGFDVIESSASFIYFAPKMDTAYLLDELNKRGVYIRDFGMVYTRVSIGLPHQNEQFITALKDIIK
ncbi:MAG: pyridoxal phosphate-dependent aminotransferase [Coprobacillaceae bacterium]